MNYQQKPAPRTEHKSFEDARDAAAEKYGIHIVDNMHSLGTYKQADFKAGWDACLAHIMQELEEAKAWSGSWSEKTFAWLIFIMLAIYLSSLITPLSPI